MADIMELATYVQEFTRRLNLEVDQARLDCSVHELMLLAESMAHNALHHFSTVFRALSYAFGLLIEVRGLACFDRDRPAPMWSSVRDPLLVQALEHFRVDRSVTHDVQMLVSIDWRLHASLAEIDCADLWPQSPHAQPDDRKLSMCPDGTSPPADSVESPKSASVRTTKRKAWARLDRERADAKKSRTCSLNIQCHSHRGDK
jgi:hypothetical protein